MLSIKSASAATVVLCLCLTSVGVVHAQDTIPGEQLDPTTYGPSYVESFADVVNRDLLTRPPEPKGRDGQQGTWMVPSLGATGRAHSGSCYVINKWGDTRMGIGFPQPVDVHGAYFAGQSAPGVWARGIQVLGYRADELVQKSPWLHDITAKPTWMEIGLRDVDRIVIVAVPAVGGAGWYALDDLTYSIANADAPQPIVINFDDLKFRTTLTGSGHAGLTWETGTGEFDEDPGVHAPLAPPGSRQGDEPPGRDEPSGTRGTLPELEATYQGVIRGDAGSMSYPPDTDGAIGPQHYVETVNRNFAVYDKHTGAELENVLLGSFLPGSNGDPRVLFDHHSGRWIVIVTDFSATATNFLAVSLTDDPLGDWFKTSFLTAQGSDAGSYPDYPTLGVDAAGIYTAAYMVGGFSMTIFAIDKAPLIAPSPSLGTITAFRNLTWEGAIQPAHTYGTGMGEYLISLYNSTGLRVRRINPPLTAPTLSEVGIVTVPYYTEPPDAPALGSSTPLDTVGDRLMMSVYRDGALWTAHTISVSGRAACRWYEINAGAATLTQSGTVADGSLYYFFPSIMVNAAGGVVLGFSGSNASQYAACYYTGRQADDPAGEMAPPVMYKAGTGQQNNIDSYGRNRWGDYSYTTLDPLDDGAMWTIQEYGHATDIWGTYMAVLRLGPPDCNQNDIPDDCDLDCGTPGGECDVPGCGESTDCNENGVPDECEPDEDCNENGVPDFCELIYGTAEDCNNNGVLDECDITAGTSEDCQPNGIPDECEVGSIAATISFPLDSDPGWSTEGLWAWGQPLGMGGQYGEPDPTGGYSGVNVYGYNLAGDYENSLPQRHLTSPPIDCTSMEDVRLCFWRWLGVEQPAYDHAYVRVSINGSYWSTVWSNTTTIEDDEWVYQELDIADIADDQPTVYLRWTMGDTDGFWQYCGWNIDDIEIRGNITAGGPNDCNMNGIPDECDIADGTSEDLNGNGRPDECEQCRGDCNCDGSIDFGDINSFVAALGNPPVYCDGTGYNADVNGSGTAGFDDINPFVELLTDYGELPLSCPGPLD